MCGIAGILRVHPPGQAPPPPEAAIPEAWLDILDDSIKHRGPDGQGRFRDRAIRPDGATVDVALVHRRLSIIDHAGGHQPMVLRGTGLPAGDSPQGATDAYRRTLDHALNPCPRCAALGHGTIAVVFNGCIYNHRDLRKELQAAGHVFSTDHSDTEVLVHGWGEWGSQLFARLEGMLALGLWDHAAANLLTVRDFAGEKPLYMSRPPTARGTAMVFGSGLPSVLRVTELAAPEPDSVLRAQYEERIALVEERRRAAAAAGVGDSAPRVDGIRATGIDLTSAELTHWRSLLADVDRGGPSRVGLTHWLPRGWSEATPLFSVHELRPATYAASHDEPGMASGSTYLEPTRQDERWRRPAALTTESAERLLRESVTRRLEADVPLGCFLSGGIDSGLIAAFAQAALVDGGARLRTFTVRMPDPRYDESAAALRTAGYLGTEHTVLDCAARPADDVVALIHQLGLPFGDSSLLPTYWLCAAARREVKVAVAGDGGDELFGGYDRYRALPLLARIGTFARLVPASLVPHGTPGSARERLRRFLHAARYGGYDELLRVFDSTDWWRLTGEQPKHGAGTMHDARPLSSDFFGYLPFDLLRKTDTAAMAVALEVRSPFLSVELIRSAFATPMDVLMPRGERKGLLRAVARKYLPPEIVDLPKQGFAIPIGEWFRTDYGGMRQLLLDHLNGPEPFGPDHLGINAMINMAFVKQMLREHEDAGVKSLWPWKGRDHSQRLYMLLVLSIWAKWLGGL